MTNLLDYHTDDWPALPPMSALIDTVHHADLFDLCAVLPDKSVDMILCDLPYGTTACSWDEIIPFAPMWKAFRRITKPKAAIVLTASQPFTSTLICSNLKMFRYSWVWDKVKGGNIYLAKYQPMKIHEDVLIFSQEPTSYYPEMRKRNEIKKSENYGTGEAFGGNGLPESTIYFYDHTFPISIVTISNANQSDKEHPTQKPVDLFRYLIRTYTQPGQLVFDPCVGSGTTAIAARTEGRRYIVGDSSAEYIQVTRDRLAAPYTPMFEALLTA